MQIPRIIATAVLVLSFARPLESISPLSILQPRLWQRPKNFPEGAWHAAQKCITMAKKTSIEEDVLAIFEPGGPGGKVVFSNTHGLASFRRPLYYAFCIILFADLATNK
jgi:hypothetical protein